MAGGNPCFQLAENRAFPDGVVALRGFAYKPLW